MLGIPVMLGTGVTYLYDIPILQDECESTRHAG